MNKEERKYFNRGDKVYWEDMDIEIGDTIYCIKYDENVDMWEQHLTIGKPYIIEDLEYKFPDSICVTGDRISMFYPAKLFSNDIKLIRKIKIEKIEKKS